MFYLLMNGEAEVFKTDVPTADGAATSAEVVVGRLSPGSYFGEVCTAAAVVTHVTT